MANAPSRSSGSFSLGLGLLVIPCSLYTGTEDSGIKRSQYVKTEDGGYHKVRMRTVDEETGDEVTRDKITKLYECEDGSLVELSDAEIEAAVGAANGSATIEAFMPNEWLGSRYITDSLLQVRPARRKVGSKSKPDPNAEKAFTVLTQAMLEEGVFALIQFATRGKPKYGALLGDGRLFTLLFDEEIRDDLPLPDAEISEAEMAMGIQLVTSLKASEPIELEDTATVKVNEYATAKAGGAAPVQIEAKEPEAAGDLLAALQAAVDVAKSKA